MYHPERTWRGIRRIANALLGCLGPPLDRRTIRAPNVSSVGKPGSGVKEDQPAREARKKIPEVVAASHVRELMAQNIGKLSRA